MSSAPATVVLVHGAWHGSWCWERVVRELAARGVTARTLDLPSVGGAPGESLTSDAAAVRKVIDAERGPVVLCGHSYGGMVISLAAAASERVARLIYLCAFVPEDGQSLVTTGGGGELAPWICHNADGSTIPDLTRAPELFFGDCDPPTQAWAVGKLRPQRPEAFSEPVPQPAWRRIDSTFIVCAQDGAMPPELQRGVFAPRARRVIELHSGHSPFLSQPVALAGVLATEATDAGAHSA
jgi:pimeloyl-ACP methyl ester carboxylesterase